MAPSVVGMVLVESSWVRQTGMSALFERVPESRAPSGDVRIIFVTSYNISDSTFAGRDLLIKRILRSWRRLQDTCFVNMISTFQFQDGSADRPAPKIELALFWSSGGGLLACNQSASGRRTARHLRQRS
jgi:hypothetical protein